MAQKDQHSSESKEESENNDASKSDSSEQGEEISTESKGQQEHASKKAQTSSQNQQSHSKSEGQQEQNTAKSSSGKAPTSQSASDSEAHSKLKSNNKRKIQDVDDGIEDAQVVKKLQFQRLWSEEDEIMILRGMIKYIAKKGFMDLNGFYNHIKKSIRFDASKAQLSDKIRRLKKRYKSNVEKNRRITTSHELKLNDFSKKIWGDEVSVGVEKCHQANKTVQNNDKNGRVASVVNDLKPPVSVQVNRSIGVRLSLGADIVDVGLGLIEGSKRLEFEEKWKKQWANEVKLYMNRLELTYEQAEAVLESLNSKT